jgi:cell division septation protein DedD
MNRVLILFAAVVLSTAGCTRTQTALKSDDEFKKALQESDKSKSKKIDFLADEKLPNAEVVVKDTASKNQKEDQANIHPMDYAEVPPPQKARYRLQIFAGSAANAQKNYSKLSTEVPNGEVYMINDKASGLWKIWVGNYATHEEAEKAKEKYIKTGYPDSWVHEMKGEFAPSENLIWVQVGALQNDAAAQKLKSELESKQKEKVQIERTDKIWKVWVGGYADKKQAEDLKKKLHGLGYAKAFVVKAGEK